MFLVILRNVLKCFIDVFEKRCLFEKTQIKFNFSILWKIFLFLLIKNKHSECYPVLETTVFQLFLAHLKRKQTTPPHSQMSFPLSGNPFSCPDGYLDSRLLLEFQFRFYLLWSLNLLYFFPRNSLGPSHVYMTTVLNTRELALELLTYMSTVA